jgi:Fic family protein
MVFNRNKPFNDLPLLPPEADLESKAILKKAIVANRELAELKGAGDAIPNQAILLNSLVLQEARSSSEIENIVTTTDDAMNEALEQARTKAPKIYSKDLIELVFELPYCKIRFLEQRGIAKRQTAAVYLKTLADIGLLQSLKVGREVYYLNVPLLRILKE